MNDPMTSDLLARYLAGEASGEERAAVQAWALADPANAAELERLGRVWAAARPAAQWDVERALARVSARLDQPVPLRRPVQRRALLALAATVALALASLLLWRMLGPGTASAAAVYATAPGERRAIELSDGTRVVLAPGSELGVPAGYGGGERRVELSGEAWFEVTHDEARPFRVHGLGSITQDLGTEFSVRAVAGLPVRVVVVSGSASLRPAHAPADRAVTLHASEVGTLVAGASVAEVERGVAVEALVSWRAGRLEFNNEPLDRVLAELGRWYGLEFRLLDPSLGSSRLSAPLSLDSLDETLEVLNLTFGLTASRRADTVVLGR